VLIAAETVLLSIVGGVVGILLGFLAIGGVNELAQKYVGVDTVARFEPVLAGYALVVALCIGLVGAVYPVWLTRRTGMLEVLS
jgi:putative ABC transport system permease protein